MNRLKFLLMKIWHHGKDGVPSIRDFEHPCYSYAPGRVTMDTTTGCQTDGHYLCSGCKLQELAYECPTDCIFSWSTEGPWDNPTDGGCVFEDKFPPGTTLEPISTHRLCPYYKPKATKDI